MFVILHHNMPSFTDQTRAKTCTRQASNAYHVAVALLSSFKLKRVRHAHISLCLKSGATTPNLPKTISSTLPMIMDKTKRVAITHPDVLADLEW